MKKRYYLLDALRGITIVSMIGYHGLWDIRYFLDITFNAVESDWIYLWQQSICWVFILLSGFSQSLGSRQLRRNLQVFAAGLLITTITLLFLPNERIVFGILTFLGTAGLLISVLKYLAVKWKLPGIPHVVLLTASVLLFLFFRNIDSGSLGFEGLRFFDLPPAFYQNYVTAFLGFPPKDFTSQDYFPLFPWIFLYGAGYECYFILMEGKMNEWLTSFRIRPLEWMGRHSLTLYLLHQPVLYGSIWVLSRL